MHPKSPKLLEDIRDSAAFIHAATRAARLGSRHARAPGLGMAPTTDYGTQGWALVSGKPKGVLEGHGITS